MESLDDLNCPVCLEISRNAVESQCCGHAFCEQCALLVKNKQNQCPFCKCTPLAYREGKLIRRMISSIKVPCTNEKCEQKICNSDLTSHLEYCIFGNTSCRVCNQKFIRGELVKHTIEKHEDQTRKAIIDYQNSEKSKISSASTNASKVGSSNIVGPISTVIDPATEVKNRAGRITCIGTSGKFYCGGPLLLKCSCCDGNCGRTNGQNCLGCMQLDIKMRSLPKGYLVNAVGNIAKVNINTSSAYCGALSGFSNTKCTLGTVCQYCKNLTKTLKRYQALLKQ